MPSSIDMRQVVVIVGVIEDAGCMVAKPVEFCDLGSLPFELSCESCWISHLATVAGNAHGQHDDRCGISLGLNGVLTTLHSAGQSVGA